MTAFPLLRPLFALLLLSTAACGEAAVSRRTAAPRTTGAKVTAAAPEAGPTIDALRTRETTTPLTDFRVRAADGAIELHMKASAAPTVSHRKRGELGALSVVSFPIGAEVNVACHAAATPIDLAHWVQAILEAIHTELTEAPALEVEVVAGHPVLFVHTEGILEVDGVKKRHIAKFALAHFDDGSVACVHDGVGYEATFRDVMRHVVTASKTPEAERPGFRTVSVEYDDERVVGFEELRTYRGAKPGESRQVTLTSSIVTSTKGWLPRDSGWSGLVDKQGVVRERSIRRSGKAVVVDMALERTSSGLYSYEGTVGGTPKKGTFRSREPLATHFSRAPGLAAFARDTRKKELAIAHFDEVLPAAALRSVITHESGNQLGVVDNGVSFHCALDAQGLCTRLWRDGSPWSRKRVFVAGTP